MQRRRRRTPEILDLLTSLADKNLAVTETHGSWHDSACSRPSGIMRETGCAKAARKRRCATAISSSFSASPPLVDPMQTDSELHSKLLRLDQEHDNVRAALLWSEASPARSGRGLGLAGGLHWFWRMRGHYAEARDWIARLLALAAGRSGRSPCQCVHAVGALTYLQATTPRPGPHREALEIWSQLGNRRGVGRSLNSLGNIARSRGELPAARELYREALSIAREVGDRRSVSMNLHCLGTVAHASGDYAPAQALLEECVSISRDIGAWRVAIALTELGEVKHAGGPRSSARPLLAALEAITRWGTDPASRRPSSRWRRYRTMSATSIPQGLPQGSAGHRAHRRQALAGDMARCLCWAVGANGARDVRGAHLGRTQRSREQIGSPCPLRSALGRTVGGHRPRRSHDEAAFVSAWNEGRTWTLDEGLHYALKS